MLQKGGMLITYHNGPHAAHKSEMMALEIHKAPHLTIHNLPSSMTKTEWVREDAVKSHRLEWMKGHGESKDEDEDKALVQCARYPAEASLLLNRTLVC